MKVFRLGKSGHVSDRALWHASGLTFSTMMVGRPSMEELKKDPEIAENSVPLSGPERLAFFREMLALAIPEKVPWKVGDWNNPVCFT